MSLRRSDSVDIIRFLRRHTQALEDGSHPTYFRWGGYGVNDNWQTLATLAGYAADETLRIRARADIVYLRGVVHSLLPGGAWPTKPCAKVPDGQHSPTRVYHLFGRTTAGNLVRVKVAQNGSITPSAPSDGTTVSFAGVSWVNG